MFLSELCATYRALPGFEVEGDPHLPHFSLVGFFASLLIPLDCYLLP